MNIYYVLGRISTHPAERTHELLPDRWQELRRAGDAAPDCDAAPD
jgi:hypothetical protein